MQNKETHWAFSNINLQSKTTESGGNGSSGCGGKTGYPTELNIQTRIEGEETGADPIETMAQSNQSAAGLPTQAQTDAGKSADRPTPAQLDNTANSTDCDPNARTGGNGSTDCDNKTGYPTELSLEP